MDKTKTNVLDLTWSSFASRGDENVDRIRLVLTKQDSNQVVDIAETEINEAQVSFALQSLDDQYSFQPTVDTGALSVSEYIYLDVAEANVDV
jgi:hypothetical protein